MSIHRRAAPTIKRGRNLTTGDVFMIARTAYTATGPARLIEGAWLIPTTRPYGGGVRLALTAVEPDTDYDIRAAQDGATE